MNAGADPGAVAAAAVDAIDRAAHPESAVDDATQQPLRARAAQLDQIRAAVTAGVPDRRGHRSPTEWLAAVTHEPLGRCKRTVR